MSNFRKRLRLDCNTINPAIFVPTVFEPCFDCAQHSIHCGLSEAEIRAQYKVFYCRFN